MWNPDLSTTSLLPWIGNDIWEWLAAAAAHFPNPYQAEGRRVSGGFFVCFYTIGLQLLLLWPFKGIFRAKSFPPISPWQGCWQGCAEHLCWTWQLHIHPSGFLTPEVERGVAHRTSPQGRGLSMWSGNSPRAACIEGQTSVKVWKPPAQTRHHSAAWGRVTSLMQTSRAEGHSEVKSRGRTQSCITHSFKGLMLNELLATKESKDSAKSAISTWEESSPQTRHVTTSPFNPFSTSKGKRGQKTYKR